MAEKDFVLAVSPEGQKRMVPKHYLEAPFNYKLAPSQRVQEPAKAVEETTSGGEVALVTEPGDKPASKKEVKG